MSSSRSGKADLHRKNVKTINIVVTTCTGGPLCRSRHVSSHFGLGGASTDCLPKPNSLAGWCRRSNLPRLQRSMSWATCSWASQALLGVCRILPRSGQRP